jgi:Zn-dependent peptidase ImmA (M78 family)/DNA-binding XRE family transcriptional regulator
VNSRAFQPVRLKLARQLTGMQQKTLADEIDVSPSAISQLEGGSVQPGAEMLDRLAIVLRCRPSFFFRPFPSFALELPFFRSRRAAPKGERDRALAYAQLIYEVAELMESYVDLPPNEVWETFSLDQGAELREVEGAASALRQAWEVPSGPIPHVVRLLEARGAIATAVGVFDKRLDAFSLRGRTRPVVVLCSDQGSAARRRFDAAHELAHLVLHAEPSEPNHWQERQAHQFASAFLLPKDQVEPWLPRKSHELEVLEEGSRIWGTSMQALLFRARDVGTLSEDSYRRAMQRLSAAGWRTREPVDMGPAEAPELLQLAVGSLAAGGGSLETIASAIGLPKGRLARMMSLPEDQQEDVAQVIELGKKVA